MKPSILFVSFLLVSISLEVSADVDLFQEAATLYNQAGFTEAIDLYKKIITDNPRDPEAYLNLVYLYIELAEFKKAIDITSNALKIFKDNQFRILLGRIYYLVGNPKQAIAHFNELLTSGLGEYQTLFYLGLCYEDVGQLTKAEEFYSEVIKLKPDNVLACLKLGNIYYQAHRLNEAVETYQKIISLDPSITQARIRLAECFTELGEFKEAYEQYAKHAAIHPEDKASLRNLEEIKEKLGESFFERKKRLISQMRQKKSIQIQASGFAERATEVRIGVAKIKGTVEFKAGSPFEIIDKHSGKSIFKGQEESIYSLVFNKTSGVKLKDYKGNILALDLNDAFLIKNNSPNTVISIFDIPVGTGSFWAGWRDQQYRGIIEVVPDNNGFWLINLVNLEEYLYGVLPSEMPSDWPGEALRVQAIAARTWAIKNKTRHRHEGFNFCSSVHCQVYKGAGTETQITNQAVDDTAGLILAHNNHPIDIFYSNNCGGCTQTGVIDSSSLDYHFPLSPLELEKWLMEKPNAFCNLKEERSANFRWVRFYRQEQLQMMFDRAGIDIGEFIKIIPHRRAASGHLLSIEIIGTGSIKLIEGEYNIRKILGNLLSSAFKIEVKYNQEKSTSEFIFYGAGFGHGRGLCQTGVKGMALEGYNYRQILKHYYPDSQIKTQY